MPGILYKLKQISQHVLRIQNIYLLPKYIKYISKGVIILAFAYVKAGFNKIKKKALCLKHKSLPVSTSYLVT